MTRQDAGELWSDDQSPKRADMGSRGLNCKRRLELEGTLSTMSPVAAAPRPWENEEEPLLNEEKLQNDKGYTRLVMYNSVLCEYLSRHAFAPFTSSSTCSREPKRHWVYYPSPKLQFVFVALQAAFMLFFFFSTLLALAAGGKDGDHEPYYAHAISVAMGRSACLLRFMTAKAACLLFFCAWYRHPLFPVRREISSPPETPDLADEHQDQLRRLALASEDSEKLGETQALVQPQTATTYGHLLHENKLNSRGSSFLASSGSEADRDDFLPFEDELDKIGSRDEQDEDEVDQDHKNARVTASQQGGLYMDEETERGIWLQQEDQDVVPRTPRGLYSSTSTGARTKNHPNQPKRHHMEQEQMKLSFFSNLDTAMPIKDLWLDFEARTNEPLLYSSRLCLPNLILVQTALIGSICLVLSSWDVITPTFFLIFYTVVLAISGLLGAVDMWRLFRSAPEEFKFEKCPLIKPASIQEAEAREFALVVKVYAAGESKCRSAVDSVYEVLVSGTKNFQHIMTRPESPTASIFNFGREDAGSDAISRRQSGSQRRARSSGRIHNTSSTDVRPIIAAGTSQSAADGRGEEQSHSNALARTPSTGSDFSAWMQSSLIWRLFFPVQDDQVATQAEAEDEGLRYRHKRASLTGRASMRSNHVESLLSEGDPIGTCSGEGKPILWEIEYSSGGDSEAYYNQENKNPSSSIYRSCQSQNQETKSDTKPDPSTFVDGETADASQETHRGQQEAQIDDGLNTTKEDLARTVDIENEHLEEHVDLESGQLFVNHDAISVLTPVQLLSKPGVEQDTITTSGSTATPRSSASLFSDHVALTNKVVISSIGAPQADEQVPSSGTATVIATSSSGDEDAEPDKTTQQGVLKNTTHLCEAPEVKTVRKVASSSQGHQTVQHFGLADGTTTSENVSAQTSKESTGPFSSTAIALANAHAGHDKPTSLTSSSKATTASAKTGKMSDKLVASSSSTTAASQGSSKKSEVSKPKRDEEYYKDGPRDMVEVSLYRRPAFRRKWTREVRRFMYHLEVGFVMSWCLCGTLLVSMVLFLAHASHPFDIAKESTANTVYATQWISLACICLWPALHLTPLALLCG
ncbi:unnamed protein product [Amoebophrya sp. A25]|nr:unnamed protein product [Amoebophrya sp. A25]|eukprot:GSA25T00011277001.1